MDPWGPYQLPEMVAMAKARNDAQFAHDCALIALLGNALSTSPRPLESLKPFNGMEDEPCPRR